MKRFTFRSEITVVRECVVEAVDRKEAEALLTQVPPESWKDVTQQSRRGLELISVEDLQPPAVAATPKAKTGKR